MKSKINKYKINNNNTSTKHELKILAKKHFKYFFLNDAKKHYTFLWKHVSMKLLEFSLMFYEGEVKSPCFLQVW